MSVPDPDFTDIVGQLGDPEWPDDLTDPEKDGPAPLTEAAVLYDGPVRVDYHQIQIMWDPAFLLVDDDNDDDLLADNPPPAAPSEFDGQTNGILGAARPGGLLIIAAGQDGTTRLRVEYDPAPPAAPGSEWEDVVDVSTTLPEAAALTLHPAGVKQEGRLGVFPGGTYRVRLSCRGRDAAATRTHPSPTPSRIANPDSYLVQFWPAPTAPDAVVRTLSADAAYWHSDE